MKKINLQSHVRELFREEGLLDHLPTFEEYIKDMPLIEQIKMYYDVDIENYIGNPWEIVAEIAEDCPNWLEDFRAEFKKYLQERDYIQ